jgi:hypothetical protein
MNAVAQFPQALAMSLKIENFELRCTRPTTTKGTRRDGNS